MITPAIRYISSFQDATSSSSIPVPTPVMVDGRIWDQKNLNVSTYRDGTPIPQVKTGWSALTTGAWRYYNDNPASAAVYGRLYNWYALMGIHDAASSLDPSLRKNIAPVDWEVATYGEWITLRNILGRSVAAIALKEAGPAHWGSTNIGTNSSYFTALPGGYKPGNTNTTFLGIGSAGYWWPKDYSGLGNFSLTNTSNSLLFYANVGANRGSSIRLIKPSTIIPGFTTTYPTTITSTSFLGTGGYIPTDYTGTITERGIVYGTSIDPTIANTKIQSGTGTGSYTINITGLSINTQYFIRAYAVSSIDGVIYANNISVFTLNSAPTVFTNNISQITTNSAVSGGYIEDDGGLAITAKGVCYSSTTQNPTIGDSTTNNGSGIEPFISEMTGLALNTKYYVRAYATNSSTTGYGPGREFTTLAVPSLNLIFNQYYAYHAYSLRTLSDTYDYKCVRVRRTTTTPTVTTTTVDVFFNLYSEIGLYSDIVYVSGTTTLATNLGDFAAAVASGYISNPDGININQNIFIVTWYDQSGNGKNITQTTLSSQPRLVTTGNLEKDINNKTATRFSGAQLLALNDSSVSYNDESVYVVGSATSTSTMNFYGQGHLDSNARMFIGRAGGIWYDNEEAVLPTFPTPNFTPNIPILYELICGLSTTSSYSNGVQLSPFSKPSLNVTNTYIRVGQNSAAPTISSNGLIQEVICFIGTPLEEYISPNIMDYYGIQRPPQITTADVNYIEPTGTATGGGNLTEDFGVTQTVKGVCWNTFPDPALGFGAATSDGSGIGPFTSNLTFLAAYTTYYAKAYAINSTGVTYGEEKQFITGNAPMNLILDLYPLAYHAYSLRKLRSAYTEACLRVRRTTTIPSVTTTTVDLHFDTFGTISLNSVIAYVSGTITAARSLGEFCAAPGFTNADGYNSCEIFVSTWFDQSGNNKNVTSTTLSAQPRLVRLDTGVPTLETSGGKAAVRFTNTSSQRLALADASVPLNNVSSYALGNSLATANNAVMSLGDTVGTNLFWLPQASSISYRSQNVWSNGNIANQPRLYELICGTSVVNAYANGGLRTPTAPPTPMTGTNSAIRIGQYSTIIYMNGYVTEVISFVGTSNRTQIESNINTYYNVW
jgi:uncharacterized protein (TIGR02145 family)